jgi:hypothetical protein
MTDPLPCPICGGTEFSVEFDEIDRGDHAQPCAALICDMYDEDTDIYRPTVESLLNEEEDAEEQATIAWNEWVLKQRKQ